MNIPEVKLDIMQDFRKEGTSIVTSQERAVISALKERPEAVQKLDKAESDSSRKSFTKAEMAAMVKDIESKLQSKEVQLKFNVIEESDTIQVEVLNAEGKVIRKIPEDAMVKLSQSLKDLARGFLDTKS